MRGERGEEEKEAKEAREARRGGRIILHGLVLNHDCVLTKKGGPVRFGTAVIMQSQIQSAEKQ